MSQDSYPVPDEFRKHAHITEQCYREMYRRSVEDPEGFWTEQATTFIDWSGTWKRVLDWDFHTGYVRWFEGGRLNACYNCVDRHLAVRGDQTAIIWEGNEPGQGRSITYRELHEQVSRLANALKDRGIGKGDRVCLYMPMIPEAVFAMLACARIGAIHSVVFAGFSSEAFKHRVQDSDCRLVVVADGYRHGSKTIEHKKKADQALKECPGVNTVLVVKRLGGDIPWNSARDVWYHEAVAKSSPDCPVVEMDAEAPPTYCDKIHEAEEILKECTLCPRECRVDRTSDERGFCRTGDKPFISSWGPHFGEEKPLVGRYGSGTIFFGNCNLGCLYGQTYSISHLGEGVEMSFEKLADIMVSLQKEGCHNINFVTPTHQMPMILRSLQIASQKGLNVPIVYN